LKTVAWFSGGVSSFVSIWQSRNILDEIIYIDIDDQHHDTYRFLTDCEKVLGGTITRLKSPYKNVDNVIRTFKYVNGVAGARCTDVLKRRVRKEWEYSQEDKLRYVWGYDFKERKRINEMIKQNPMQDHIFPLFEKRQEKPNAHFILESLGIKRPEMYDMGYPNNNCIGCVKGGMGYWNKIRADFPDVFAKRAEAERFVGASCINGVFLDELDPNRGHKQKIILPDCGILCELEEKNY